MVKLTKKMQEILEKADLERGEINNVSWQTMYGLEDRNLITDDWRRKSVSSGIITTTGGGSFPVFCKVKLTSDGIIAARSVQGLKGV